MLIGRSQLGWVISCEYGWVNSDERQRLLHLKLRHADLHSPIKDLLFYDISGENFDRAKNSIEECNELILLNRFDHLVILIDGEKIIEFDQRQKAFSDDRMLLRSFLDSNILKNDSFVDILFTKWDLIHSSPEKGEHEKFIMHIEESISEMFEDSVGRLRFSNIASRPAGNILPLGYGFENIFESWVEESPYSLNRAANKFRESENACEFDRFFKRYLPEFFEDNS